MLTPLSPLKGIARFGRTPKQLLTPVVGRCPVCGDAVRSTDPALTLRGGIHVHRACATYRTRQRARTL